MNKDQIANIKDYESSIKTIEDAFEGIRENIGMYIGGRGNRGHINTIREIAQNALDEMMKPTSPCTEVHVYYNEQTKEAKVRDNGRGIPFNSMVRIFRNVNTSSNYTKKPGEYSSGKHGMGAKVTNALASKFTVESYILGEGREVYWTDGGKKQSKITKIPNKDNYQGSIISFIPDETDDHQHLGPVSTKCVGKNGEIGVLDFIRGISPLTRIGDKIYFEGITLDGQKVKETVVNEDGIVTYIIATCEKPLIAPIMISGDNGLLKADIALTFDVGNLTGGECITNYCNFCPMRSGTHIEGLKEGVYRWFTDYMNKVYLSSTNKKAKKKLTCNKADVMNSLNAVIAAAALHPIFGGQAKDSLENVEMKDYVKELVMTSLDKWAKTNTSDLLKVCKLLKEITEVRIKGEGEKIKIASNYSKSAITSLPSKFFPASGKKDLELIIVEGDSAKGSTDNARDKEKQALFPIRGKMPNPVDTPRAKYLNNAEVQGIISILGAGQPGKDFDASKVKYDKIIIMADADYDGFHIRTLVLKLFLFYMPELVEQGKIYCSVPPLYGIKKGKKIVKYLTDKSEYATFLTEEFVKNNAISYVDGKKITKADLCNNVLRYEDYMNLVNEYIANYPTSTKFLEYLMIKMVSVGIKDMNKLYKAINKDLKKKFRFMSARFVNNTISLEGIVDMKDNTIVLNRNKIEELLPLLYIVKNAPMEYTLNGNKCGLYDLMKAHEKAAAHLGDLERYKGLGEMTAQRLGESTVRADGRRTLIRYTCDNVKMFKKQVIDIESDRRQLLEDKSIVIPKDEMMG